MRLVKCFLWSAAFFAFTGLMPAAAQVGDPPVIEIFGDFCEEVDTAAVDAFESLVNAGQDKAECIQRLSDCPEGLFNNDPVSCLTDAMECTANAETDAVEACGDFSEDVTDAYADALRQARRQGPGVERRLQRLMDSRRGQDCLAHATLVAESCNENQ